MAEDTTASPHPTPAEPNETHHDNPIFDDADSLLDSESQITDSTSLNSSILRYREENGRTYHSYGSTEHWGPNDASAQDQQDLSHHMWTLMLRGDLYNAPVQQPHRILDMGTGTGIWAIDVAEKHPEATVKGIDLSPIQPIWVPPNVYFEVDDYNLESTDTKKYDLVHCRELLGSVPDWPEFYQKCFKALKPGGWLDCSEPDLYFTSDYVNLGPNDPYKQWSDAMYAAGNDAGLTFDVGPYIRQRLEDAGFVNVTEKKVCCTIGKWSKDPWEREVGAWEQLRLVSGVQDFSSRRFVNNLGWSLDEVEILCARLRASLRNSNLLVHQCFYFVWGQKPETATD